MNIEMGDSMELNKNNIRMNKIVKTEVSTFYVNHEERLTEADSEIGSIINQKETVSVDNVAIRNNQVVINGTITYGILYYSNDSDMACGVENEIPFEEGIKINGIDENCNADVRMVVVSSSAKLIDSKNYIYKVQLMAYITVEKLEDL